MVALNSHFNVTVDMFFLAWNVKLAYMASEDSWPVCQSVIHCMYSQITSQNFSHQKITISFYCRMERVGLYVCVYIVVNFLSQVISILLLFLGMVMYANEVETKEK